MKKQSIDFSKDDIKQRIHEVLAAGPHKGLVANALMEMLDDNGLTPMFLKATMGLIPPMKYDIGFECWIEVGNLDSWSMDEGVMKKAKLIVQGKWVCAEIVDVRPFRSRPYTVRYKMIDSGGGAPKNKEYDVYEKVIHPLEEFPENLNQ